MKVPKNRRNAAARPSIALVAEALDEAYRDAVDAHQKAGQPLVFWQDGQTVLIPAEKLDVPKDGSKRRRRS